MSKQEIIQTFKNRSQEIVELLGSIEDMDLSEKERTDVVNAYDNLTVHGSISMDHIEAN